MEYYSPHQGHDRRSELVSFSYC